MGLQDAQRRVNQHQRERVIGTVLNCVIMVAYGILLELAEKISMNLMFAHLPKEYCVFLDNMLIFLD